METLDGHLGLRAGALNLAVIIEENGHITALLKLRYDSGSRQESFRGLLKNPNWKCFGQRQLSPLLKSSRTPLAGGNCREETGEDDYGDSGHHDHRNHII